jgi:hypothetical protein
VNVGSATGDRAEAVLAADEGAAGDGAAVVPMLLHPVAALMTAMTIKAYLEFTPGPPRAASLAALSRQVDAAGKAAVYGRA